MKFNPIITLKMCIGSLALLVAFSACDIDLGSQLTADAGTDQTVIIGETVTLDGSGSQDLLGSEPFDFSWAITAAPDGSTATLSGADTETPTFVPDVVGTYEVTLTVSNSSDNSTDDVTITVEDDPDNPTVAPFALDGTISEARTLGKVADDEGPDYRIDAFLVINADVVIEPGVIITFGEGAGMQIGPEGSLMAVGTTDSLITFTGDTESAGFWGGIIFGSNTSTNELTNVVVEYAGKEDFSFPGAAIFLESDGQLKMNNTIVRESDTYGIYLTTPTVDLTEFENNTLTNNNTPVFIALDRIEDLSATSTYTGNTNDFIDVYVSSTLSSDATWPTLDVPYAMPGRAILVDADITLSPGSEYIFSSNGGLEMTTNGSLNAVGTSTAPIVLRGEQDERGYWRGLSFESNNANNHLEFVEVHNGGSGGFDGFNIKSNIVAQGQARLVMNNVTMTKSAGSGLYVRDVDVRLPDFQSNVANDNVVPVVCLPQQYQYLDGDSDFTGNDDDYIESIYYSALVGNHTWQALSVPILLPDRIVSIEGDVTINDGSEFLGLSLSGLFVETTGSLNAVGTAGNGIVFRGEQNVTGYWRGVSYRSNNANNVMDHVTIANGGSRGFDGNNRQTNVEVGENALATITNSTLRDSGGYGIWVLVNATLTESGNTYSGNTLTGNTSGGGVQNDNL